mmetsp:Transcript_26200/g.19684  ORF Transcript_26200/g.19684 Transcript_26200/m.19684 type:complete len:96 (-) Transcript_26200:498-785(-)
MDLMGLMTVYSAEFQNEEKCNVPVKMWFVFYGLASLASLLFYAKFARELAKGYVLNKTRNLEFVVDVMLLVTCVIAHVLLHLNNSNCEVIAPELF